MYYIFLIMSFLAPPLVLLSIFKITLINYVFFF